MRIHPTNRTRRMWVCLVCATAVAVLAAQAMAAAADDAADTKSNINLPVRWREKDSPANAAPKSGTRAWKPSETAIVICDVWDKHWCASATKRCDAIAKQIAPLVEQARARGVHIVHCPSDTLETYRDHPARLRMKQVPPVKTLVAISSCGLDRGREGALPIDDSDGGCDCQPPCKDVNVRKWSAQHPAIRIADVDVISDNGGEVYSYFVEQGIKNVLYVGVHTNMCVLGRSFGIRQMTKLGLNTLLVRDLTDTMYNPRKAPFVEHTAGTDLVIQHIERHWCPTTDSAALLAGLR